MIRRPPRSTLFPYTTLFRSDLAGDFPLERLAEGKNRELDQRAPEGALPLLELPEIPDSVRAGGAAARNAGRLRAGHDAPYRMAGGAEREIRRNHSFGRSRPVEEAVTRSRLRGDCRGRE